VAREISNASLLMRKPECYIRNETLILRKKKKKKVFDVANQAHDYLFFLLCTVYCIFFILIYAYKKMNLKLAEQMLHNLI
jgi:hypothetical protein